MKTDWDRYYDKPFIATSFTRRIMEHKLLKLMKHYANQSHLQLVEFGGANSCFFDAIQQNIQPEAYHVIDNNKKGLDKLMARTPHFYSVKVHHCDILNLDLSDEYDLTFSVGLIEHFNTHDTAKAVEQHFNSTKSEGIVILTFPTPTLLYRITRFFAEKMRLWIFHDERPLLPDEVINTIKNHGSVLYQKTLWSMFLTQHVIVARKS